MWPAERGTCGICEQRAVRQGGKGSTHVIWCSEEDPWESDQCSAFTDPKRGCFDRCWGEEPIALSISLSIFLATYYLKEMDLRDYLTWSRDWNLGASQQAQNSGGNKCCSLEAEFFSGSLYFHSTSLQLIVCGPPHCGE
jgi:hypothetical protein